MAYKSILVQVNNGAACRPRLRAAAELGARFDARIIGLYWRQGLRIPTTSEIRDGSGLLEAQTAEAQRLEMKAHTIFSETLAAYAGPRYEWRVDNGIADEVFRRQSAYVEMYFWKLESYRYRIKLIFSTVRREIRCNDSPAKL